MLVFSHIPKTAGTTFNLLLRRYFGSRLMAARTRPHSPHTAYRKIDFERDRRWFRSLACMSGHGVKPFCDFGEAENRMQWFSFFREPESRFLSHYIHQQTGAIDGYRMPLDQWVNRFRRSNWMVRMMAGEEDLAAAKQIVRDKLQFVGITEKFDQSLDLFRKRFRLKNFDVRYGRPRMTSRDTRLRDQLAATGEQWQDLILEHNALDRELYRFVVEQLWPDQVAQCQAESPEKPTGGALPSSCSQWSNLMSFRAKDKLIYGPAVRWFG